MVAPWPAADPAHDFPQAVESMDCLMEITREVRNIRSATTSRLRSGCPWW